MNNCIFCKIASREIPSEVIAENEYFFAIKDISPLYKIHLLIIAKAHIATVSDIPADEMEHFSAAFDLAKKIAQKLDVVASGYRLTVNNGSDAGQEVPHFHMHFLAGEPLRKL
ncbi:HIT domain-containing protein [bacterium]|nr:HIT domain-containing protein [bacterium]